MKPTAKEQAIILRKDGKSIKTIARLLNVSAGSVSVWVRHVALTEEQKTILNKGHVSGQKLASAANVEKYKQQRILYQTKGREKARFSDEQYAFGCALFWGEGTKCRNSVKFCNSDPNMIKMFVSFLRKYFHVTDDQLTVSVNVYLNNGLTLSDIEKYWSSMLLVPLSNFRKATIKNSYYNKPAKVKHPYGICMVAVDSSEIVQQLFGSIKEYAGDSSDRWLT